MSPATGIGHLVISASAGSGKTFQLALRYLALLLHGVDPGRIVALTFSRKAAGEILDKILQRLAEAAAGEEGSQALRDNLREAGYEAAAGLATRPALLAALATLLHHLHAARIGTLDSFFSAILRAFPFEFGLGGSFEILDGYSLQEANREVLRRILLAAQESESRGQELLEQFKQATFGEEERGFSTRLSEFIQSYHKLLLKCPDGALWGNADAIWPGGFPVRLQDERELDDAVAEAQRQIAAAGLNEKQERRLYDFVEEARRFRAGMPIDRKLEYLLEKLLPQREQLRSSGADLILERKNTRLGPEICRPLALLTDHIIGRLLEMALRRTQGIYRLLAEFDGCYDRTVRSAGRLSFQDVQFLLGRGQLESGTLLSGRGGQDRLYIDYRLDGSFDHWLLDEFQDTSTIQWLALANLVDEILQDQEGQRTLFYVGDVKQAIYGWREGDYELFHRILEDYNGSRPLIDHRHLSRSWRSSPVIMEAVNRVFGHLNELGLPPAVCATWARGWSEHEAQRRELPGHLRLLAIPKGKKEEGGNPRFDTVAAIARELMTSGRRLSIAVLTRSNRGGRNLVDHLRSQGIAAAWEGEEGIADHPAVQALLSLALLADHPGDEQARIHLWSTPVAALLWPDPEHPRRPLFDLLEEVGGRGGFESFVLTWSDRLEQAGALDAFARLRLEQLAQAAREFDGTGQRRAVRFVEFVNDYACPQGTASRAVQVMTVHKSKGLEFDAVILPELEGKGSMTTPDLDGIQLNLRQDRFRQPRWALLFPLLFAAKSDPELADHIERKAARDCYEELCVLYVAMTRARQALYLVTNELPADGVAIHASTLLHGALADGRAGGQFPPLPIARVCASLGDSSWWTGAPPLPQSTSSLQPGAVGGATPAGPAGAMPAPAAVRVPPRRANRVSPSGSTGEAISAELLFADEGTRAASFGTAIHALMERVEWSDGVSAEEILAGHPELLPVDSRGSQEVADHFRKALLNPAISAALARPEGPARLWRERRFEALLGDDWVSGCFDRVVIREDGTGRPVGATIQDFKTNTIKDADDLRRLKKHYLPQMELYRKVLARMLALPGEAIELELIFTAAGQAATGTR